MRQNKCLEKVYPHSLRQIENIFDGGALDNHQLLYVLIMILEKQLVINHAAEQLKRLNDFNVIITDPNYFQDLYSLVL